MKRKKISRNKFIQFLCAFLALFLLVFVFVFGISSPVKKDASFEIVKGASVTAIAKQLYSAGLIDSESTFKLAVRGNGGKIQTGLYDIPAGASVWRIARMFAKGDIATVTVVVPEGLTVLQIKRLLLENSSLFVSISVINHL